MPAGIHAQVILSGGNGIDRWSVGYWIRYDVSVSIPTPVQANTYALAILNQFNSLVWSGPTSPLKARNSADTTLDTCQVRFYNGSALVVDGNATIGAVVGTSPVTHPGYVAFCVTLQTAFPGKSKRGRMYLPATGFVVSSLNLQWQVFTDMDAIVLNLAAYFVNSVHVPSWGSPASFAVVILSKLLGSTEDVINLRGDSIPDTQHGRTRSLVAAHVSTHTVP